MNLSNDWHDSTTARMNERTTTRRHENTKERVGDNATERNAAIGNARPGT